MSVLSDGRVSLRPIRRGDLPLLNAWKNDEQVYRYLGGGFQPVSMDVQEKWLDSLMDMGGSSRRFLIENEEGLAVGMIGLYDIQWVHRHCDLGIFIGDTAQQGKGYASAAYRLLADYARRYLNLGKIKATVVADNDAAVAMYRRLGFREAGRLLAERYIDGAWHDVLLMEQPLEEMSTHGAN